MSGELLYYRCNVKVEYEDAKGRVKYRKQQYIVQAVSPTDVESKVTDYLKNVDFEVDSISQTRIEDIIK
jgi:hypothetical protein